MLHNQNNGHHQQENDDHPVVPCIVHEDGVHLTFALEWNELFVSTGHWVQRKKDVEI
jgi:hypothetical protein